MDRNEAISRIRKALKARSGKTWSVTGGRGTGWGWIRIDAPPARRTWHDVPVNGGFAQQDTGKPGGCMGPADRADLERLLDLESVHHQGVSIPASTDYYVEHVDRAEGRPPSRIGRPYWD